MATTSPSTFIQSLILLCLLCTLFLQVQGDIDVDICVIGAGPSGIQAAYAAEAKGYSVAVFEKNNYVGGKTKRVTAEGSDEPYEQGAVVYAESEPGNFNELAKEFGVTAKDFTLPDMPIEWFDNATITGTPYRWSLVAEVLTYTVKRSSLNKYLVQPWAFLSDYPDELNTISTYDWFRENGMPGLAEIFFSMAALGYGHPNKIPALYGLKYMTLAKVLNSRLPCRTSSLRIFPFQELLQKMTDSLKGKVYLEASINNVTYEDSRTVIQYTLANAAPLVVPPATISCGSTIIAFAQTAEAMKMFIPRNSEKLARLFEQVKTFSYYSMLIDDADSAFASQRVQKYHVPLPAIPDNPARNLLIWKPQDFPASSVIAYYATPSQKSDEQARGL